MHSSSPLSTNNLWSLVRAATQRALQAGALAPIDTRQETIEDAGIHFLVRIVAGLAKKPTGNNTGSNPFLPYDPAMFVADIPPHHVGLLNKFQVLPNHLLIVTREFQQQTVLLTQDDFAAVCLALHSAASEQEGLAFFNGGTAAGASQPHKHLQLVPLPLSPGRVSFPFEPLLNKDRSGGIFQSDQIPFAHSAASFREPLTQNSGATVHRLYLEMIERHDLRRSAAETADYNLLLTRQLMWLVPRSQESFQNISLNALAFAGGVLVKNDQQFDLLTKQSLWNALRAVTFAK